MIVNSTNDCSQMMDSAVQQTDNFFLKRKLTLDMLDSNGSYVQQPKKRFIQNVSHNFVDAECTENFNLNGHVFNADCNGIELINFDAVTLVPPIQTTTAVFTTTLANSESFDTTWSSADLLELDQRYNTAIHLNTDFSGVVKDTSLGKEAQILNSSHETQTGIVNNQEQNNDIDFDDRNLSWLFNFKLDELPHLSPEVNRNSQLSPPNNRQQKQQNDQNIQQQTRTGRKVDELIMETTADLDENDTMTVAENVVVENTPRMPKKPPFTYTELIEYALEDKNELTVSGIYQWISDRFPFYKSNDDRWKNSVRHNLSINPHFRKGVKAAQGAGHLWTISSRDSAEHNLAWQHKKQRLELFFKMEQSYQQRKASTPPRNNSPSFDETAAAVANLTQQIQNEVNSAELMQNGCLNSGQLCNTTLTNASMNLVSNRDSDLERTAGEILNGVHRDVEVQSVHSTIITYQDSLLEGDYLNSTTSSDHLSADHHLRLSHHHNHHNDIDSAFYVTEIDPAELGINMCNVEEEVLFSDEFNLNYFGIAPGGDIVA